MMNECGLTTGTRYKYKKPHEIYQLGGRQPISITNKFQINKQLYWNNVQQYHNQQSQRSLIESNSSYQLTSHTNNHHTRSSQQISTKKHIHTQLHFLRYHHKNTNIDNRVNVFPNITKSSDKYDCQNQTDFQPLNTVNDYQFSYKTNNTLSSGSVKLQNKFCDLGKDDRQNGFYQISRQEGSDNNSKVSCKQYINYLATECNQKQLEYQFDFFKPPKQSQSKNKKIDWEKIDKHRSTQNIVDKEELMLKKSKTNQVPMVNTSFGKESILEIRKLQSTQALQKKEITDFGVKEVTNQKQSISQPFELENQNPNDKKTKGSQKQKLSQNEQRVSQNEQIQSNRGSNSRMSRKTSQFGELQDSKTPLQSPLKIINRYIQMLKPKIQHIQSCLNGRMNNLMELNQSFARTSKEIKKCLDCKYFQKLRKLMIKGVEQKTLQLHINFNDIQDFLLIKPGIFQYSDDIGSKVKLDQNKIQIIESFVRNLDEILAIKFINKYKDTNDSLIKSRSNFQKLAKKYISSNRHLIAKSNQETDNGNQVMGSFADVLDYKNDQENVKEYFQLQNTVQNIKKLEIQYGPINELSLGNRLIIQSIQNFAFDANNQNSEYE